MFREGEYVVYGYSGVCLVEGITEKEVPGTHDTRMYYALRPVQTRSSTVFVPVDSKKPLRAVMTAEEAELLIREIPKIQPLVVSNDKHREDRYKEAMRSCDYREWVRMIKTLHLRKQEREDIGKQSTAMDTRYRKTAEEYLFAELGIALNMKANEIEAYLRERLCM